MVDTFLIETEASQVSNYKIVTVKAIRKLCLPWVFISILHRQLVFCFFFFFRNKRLWGHLKSNTIPKKKFVNKTVFFFQFSSYRTKLLEKTIMITCIFCRKLLLYEFQYILLVHIVSVFLCHSGSVPRDVGIFKKFN